MSKRESIEAYLGATEQDANDLYDQAFADGVASVHQSFKDRERLEYIISECINSTLDRLGFGERSEFYDGDEHEPV